MDGRQSHLGADSGGVVLDILKVAPPGFFVFFGVKQVFQLAQYGGFNVANLLFSTLVSGKKTGSPQGV